MKIKLTELLERITPLPWSRGPYGGIYPVKTGPLISTTMTKAGSCANYNNNEPYQIHAANVLPELVESLKVALEIVEGCDPDTVTLYAPKIRSALAHAEEVEI